MAVFYFASKTGLLTETMRDMYRSYEENWQAALRQAAEDPRAQLVALITADFDPRVCSLKFCRSGSLSGASSPSPRSTERLRGPLMPAG